jgi:hypothetical protein
MLTIPNQSPFPKVYSEFNDDGRMIASPFYNRVVDVIELFIKFTLMIRAQAGYLGSLFTACRKPRCIIKARETNKNTGLIRLKFVTRLLAILSQKV